VVGEAQTPSGAAHAFLYDGTTMRDLNSLLDASAAGWEVLRALDINDAGQIVADARHSNGSEHAVLLTPWRSVPIDIKPGGFPNSINPKSRGKIPVAILSSPTFDAPAQVDRGSLTFGRTGDEPSLAFCNSGPADVNGDGLPDLVCHFHTPTTGFQAGDTEGVLKGETVAAISFSGSDSVRIVPPR
jgi:probable HAF family extracellular repeat protein